MVVSLDDSMVMVMVVHQLFMPSCGPFRTLGLLLAKKQWMIAIPTRSRSYSSDVTRFLRQYPVVVLSVRQLDHVRVAARKHTVKTHVPQSLDSPSKS
jgi:hypothetical protein